MLIPANRIFEPLFLGKTKRCFDLRADIRFADSAIEVDHEDYGRYLLEQRSVLRFRCEPFFFAKRRSVEICRIVSNVTRPRTGLSSIDTGEFFQNINRRRLSRLWR